LLTAHRLSAEPFVLLGKERSPNLELRVSKIFQLNHYAGKRSHDFPKSSQVFNPHNSKSSQRMQAKKLCVCVLGVEVLLLRFFGFRMG
jgi:hypothetical protein